MNWKIIVGPLLFFGSMWIGCYVNHFIGNTWAEFPEVVTTILICVAGAFTTVVGIVELE